MRFKSLPEFAQVAMSRALVDFFKDAPAELMLPEQPAPRWLAALRKLNVKVSPNGLLSQNAISDVVEYIESQFGCGTCQRSGLV